MGLGQLAWWLVVIGAINWGLAALNFNLVEMLFGSWPQLVTIVYLLVGVSGVYALVNSLGGKKKR